MMQQIDPHRQMVVDISSFAEIKDVQAVDLDSNHVVIVERQGGETRKVTRHCPAGIKLIKRY